MESIKKVYETQLKVSARFNQPPPPVPPAIASLYLDVVEAQSRVAERGKAEESAGEGRGCFRIRTITSFHSDPSFSLI